MAVPVWVVPLIAAAGGIIKSLIESNAQDNAMDALKGGFDQANKTINEANKKAFDMLDPYIKGGKEDYERHRHLSHSGYYDTPYSGTVQPQEFTNQKVQPKTFNRETQSYESSYEPMQFRPMASLSAPSLPKPPSAPKTSAPDPVMVRPNINIPPSISELIFEKGIEQTKNFPKNPPAGLDFHDPASVARNPYAKGVANGKDLPYSPHNLGNPNLSIVEIMRIARDGRMPGPPGSGTFIPKTYARNA